MLAAMTVALCITVAQVQMQSFAVVSLYFGSNWFDSSTMSRANVIRALEYEFPEVRFEVSECVSRRAVWEFSRRVLHDDLADINFFSAPQRQSAQLAGHALDLSGKPYISVIPTYDLDAISEKNGAIYYLPIRSSVSGLIYNQEMFDEHGWKIPTNWDELLAVCDEIYNAGMKPLTVASNIDHTLYTIFENSYMLGADSMLEAVNELNWYATGGKSLNEKHLDITLDQIDALIEHHILRPENFEISSVPTTAYLRGNTAMLLTNDVDIPYLQQMYGSHAFKFLPFWPASRSDVGYLRRDYSAAICVSGDVAQNPEHKVIVDKIMLYLSKDQGQALLRNGNGTLSENSFTAPGFYAKPWFDSVREVIKAEHFLPTIDLPGNWQSTSDALLTYVNGDISRDALQQQLSIPDHKNRNGASVCFNSRTLTTEETTRLALSAMQEAAQTQGALCLLDAGTVNSIAGKLYQGNVTENDLLCIAPGTWEKESGIDCITISGAELYRLLLGRPEFVITGFRMSRDAPATLINEAGMPADLNASYRLAVFSTSSLGGVAYDERETLGITVVDAIDGYMRANYPVGQMSAR